MGVLYFWLGTLMLFIELAGAGFMVMIVLYDPLQWVINVFGESVFRIVNVLLIIFLMALFHLGTAFIQKKLIGETFWERWKKM